MEATNEIASCTANLILFDTDSNQTSNEIDEINENNSIVIRIILDNSDEHIRVVTLETIPSTKSEMIGEKSFSTKLKDLVSCISVPTYVKTLIDILADHNLDDEAFEAIITYHKIKYLK